MATGNRKRVIQYIFQSTDRTSKVMADMSKSSDAFGKTITNISGPIVGLTTDLLKLEAAVAGVALGFIAFATNEGVRVRDTLDAVQNLTSANTDEITRFGAAFSDFSARAVFPLEQVNSTIINLTDATNTTAGAIDLLSTAERLAASTGSELDSTTSGLVTTLTAFGLGTDQAARAADVLFESAKGGRLSISQLETAFAQTGGVAQEFGLSIEDVGAFLATASGRLGASGAATAFRSLRQILERLISPSEAVRKSAADFGIQFNRSALETQGLVGFLESLGSSGGRTAEFLTEIGVRGRDLNGILAILQDDTGALSANFDRISDSAGSVNEAFERISQSATVQGQQIVNAAKTAAAGFALPFLDSFERVLSSVQRLQGALNEGLDVSSFSPLQLVIAETADAISRFLDRLTTTLPEALSQIDTSELSDALAGLRESFGGVFESLDLSTADGIANSLQSLVDGFTRLTEFTEGFVRAGTPVVGVFKDIFDIVTQIPAPIADVAGKIGLLSIGTLAIGGTFRAVGATLKTFSFLLGGPRGSLLSVLTSTTGKIGLFNTSLLAMAPAAAAAGFEIGKLLPPVNGITFGFTSLLGLVLDLSLKIPGVGDAVISISESIEEWTTVNEQAIPPLQRIREESTNTAAAVTEMNAALKETPEPILETETAALRLGFALAEVNKQGVNIGSTQELAAKGFDVVTLSLGNAEEGYREVANVITNVGQASQSATDTLTKNLDEVVTDTEKFRLETAKLNLEYAKLTSQERRLRFEVQADLRVAEIEQGTKRIEEAFATIRAGIESTQQGLSTLVGGLLDASGSTRTLIRELIREEEKRRRAAFELSQEREKAELRLLRAQTNFFNSGESLIQVNGDNLKTHLEAIFLEILEETSLQVNANGGVFLAALPQAI